MSVIEQGLWFRKFQQSIPPAFTADTAGFKSAEACPTRHR